MFDARELGILISGSSTGFNVADLKEHTVYAGGYNEARQLRRIFGSCSNMFNFKYLQIMICKLLFFMCIHLPHLHRSPVDSSLMSH